MLKIGLIIIIICSLSLKLSSTLHFKETVQNTDNFFNNIITKYEKTDLHEVQASIDKEIAQYLKITSQQLHITRYKKDLVKSNAQTDVEVFNRLEEVFSLNDLNVRDISVFRKFIGYEQWFVATLTITDIIVYKIFQGKLHQQVLFPIQDASKLQTVKFRDSIFLFSQQPQILTTFYFFTREQKFSMREINKLAIEDLQDFSVWYKDEELFLAASTFNHMIIYTWKTDHFNRLQVLPFDSQLKFSKVYPRDGDRDGDYELLVVTKKATEFFSYDPRVRQFIAVQSVHRSFDDVAFLVLRNSKLSESLLILANGRQPSIVYKRSSDVFEGFLPFQQIGSAHRVIAIKNNNTLLLILLKNGLMDIYQYDGWRFIRLDSQIVGIHDVKKVDYEGQHMIFVKRNDGIWKLNRINWRKVGQPVNFNDDIYKWCLTAKDSTNRVPKPPETKSSIHMSMGQLKRAKAKRVNGISIDKFRDLTEHYKRLLSRLSVIDDFFNQTMSKIHRLKTVRAQSIRAECTNQCKANNLIVNLGCDIFSNLPKVGDKTQSIAFERVKVDTLDGFPCPVAAIQLKEVNVEGLLNGADFNEVNKHALRTRGDQVISAEHIFADLRVEHLFAPNIEPASTHTRQSIRTTSIHAKEFNLTDHNLLLPLDGEPVIMTGSLTASKVKFNGLIDQRGGIKGRSSKRYAPMVSFPEYHELNGDYHLSNVKITGLLSASDVARSKGTTEKTLGDIVKKIVRLDEDVPIRLALRSNTTLWHNVTLQSLPNWLTKKNRDTVTVMGEKIALKKVTFSDSLYKKLPLPKIETPICSLGAVTSDIRTSTISVGQAEAKLVESQNVIGAKDLDEVMRDSVISLSEVDLSGKTFSGAVKVTNLNIVDLENSPFYSFQKSDVKWYRPDVISGPVRVTNLSVDSLTTKEGIRIPCPSEIRNMIVEGNLDVETINGIELEDFFNNTVKLTDNLSLKNVTFEGVLEVEEVETTNVNIDLQNFENGAFLGNKTISGDLIIEGDLRIPNVLSYPPNNQVQSYVVEGSVKFRKEPSVINFNGKNLHQLLSEIWLLNRPTTLKGSFEFDTVALSHSVPLYKSLQTPYFGSWESLESRLLSKTKLQEITVPVYIKTARIPNIIITENFTLHSSDQYLNDLLYMTLKKKGNQTVRDSWHFRELIIQNNLSLLGMLNNLNLSTDVAMHNADNNYVTGKKVIEKLILRNLKGLKFNEWTNNAFIPSDNRNPVVIKDRKTFDYLNARLVHVNGRVMDKKLEECLLKTGDQVITAAIVINGSIHAPSLRVDGLLNNVNLNSIANNLLKKREPIQKIKSKVIFKGNLQVMADLLVQSSWQNVELSKMKFLNETVAPSMQKLNHLKPFAIGIENTMQRRAKYWDKFELVDEKVLASIVDLKSAITTTTRFHLIGSCVLRSLFEVTCNANTQNTYPLKQLSNCTEVLINQLLSVDSVPLVIQVTSGTRSRITIYMYDYITNSFDIAKSIRAPGIREASVSTLNGVVWIATRLESQMLLIRFETWNDLQKYNLPDSRIFALDIVPASNELVLVRDDGMWKLEGLAGPRHAFKINLKADRFETFTRGHDYFVRLIRKNEASKLLRARYVGV